MAKEEEGGEKEEEWEESALELGEGREIVVNLTIRYITKKFKKIFN